MNPGRELDALVAEKVMGLEVVPIKFGEYEYLLEVRPDGGRKSLPVPLYSTDIAAAWEVVEKFQNINLTRGLAGQYVCRFGIVRGETITQVEARGSTAPHALCLAALKTVGVE